MKGLGNARVGKSVLEPEIRLIHSHMDGVHPEGHRQCGSELPMGPDQRGKQKPSRKTLSIKLKSQWTCFFYS